MMSLRWRIMGSIVFVVVLTVLTSIGVGYYATQQRLGVFVEEIGDQRASRLARNLSLEYTGAGGWETVDRPLSEAGNVYNEVPRREPHEEGEGEFREIFHRDPVRIVIVGVDGLVVRDNLSRLPPGAAAPDLNGRRETVFDLAADKPVGHVYVDVDHEFLSDESHGFLSTLLYITVIAGMLTTGVAILLAAWLSKRITAPVTALTEATQAIAQGGSARLPVTSRDELGQMSAAFNGMTFALKTQRELRRRLINDLCSRIEYTAERHTTGGKGAAGRTPNAGERLRPHHPGSGKTARSRDGPELACGDGPRGVEAHRGNRSAPRPAHLRRGTLAAGGPGPAG